MRIWWLIVGFLLVQPLRVESASIVVDTPVGLPGETVEVAVRFVGDGEDVSGAVTEVSFDPAVPIVPGRSGHPDCNEEIEAAEVISGFRYRPLSCTFGVDCEAVLGAVLAFSGVLPDGVLFTCRIGIAADAPTDTTFPLEVVESTVSDPSGMETDVTEESLDGEVLVVGEPLCVGDCDGDGTVAVAELVTGVDHALVRGAGMDCPLGDREADGTVDLFELLAAVGNSLAGCPTSAMRAPGREVVALPSAATRDER